MQDAIIFVKWTFLKNIIQNVNNQSLKWHWSSLSILFGHNAMLINNCIYQPSSLFQQLLSLSPSLIFFYFTNIYVHSRSWNIRYLKILVSILETQCEVLKRRKFGKLLSKCLCTCDSHACNETRDTTSYLIHPSSDMDKDLSKYSVS